MRRLFAVYLGGKAKGASIEVHDVAFAAGKRIQDTLSQLRSVWFGTAESLHIDSWMELKYVDGYEVSLTDQPAAKTAPKLFFINIGSYSNEIFGENHRFFFVVARNSLEAKKKAKAKVSKREVLPHTDNLLAIDSIVPVRKAGEFYVNIRKSETKESSSGVTNTYWPIAMKRRGH